MDCDTLEEWDVGGVGGGGEVEGRLKRERIYVYVWLIHVIQQKHTQHCKTISLQFFLK